MSIPAKTLHRSLVLAGLAAVPFALSLQVSAQSWEGDTDRLWTNANNWSANTLPSFTNTTDLSFPTSGAPVVTPNFNTVLGALTPTVRSLNFGADVDSVFRIGLQENTSGTRVPRSLTLGGAGGAAINVDAGASGNIQIGDVFLGTGGSIGSIILAGDLAVDHKGTGTLLFSRPVTGAFKITKSGAGTLEANGGGHTFSSLDIQGGTVRATAAADISAVTNITMATGTKLIVNATTTAKTYSAASATLTVNGASTLEYQATSTGTGAGLTLGGTGGTITLNGNLTLDNLSSTPTTGTNGITLARTISGTGSLLINGFQDISSGADVYSLGRVTISGNNTGWSGDILINKGTVSLGGATSSTHAPAGTGDIYLGATASNAGAGLTYFFTAGGDLTQTVNNDIVVRSGGFRSIKGGASDHNLILSGGVSLEGNLNVDHTGVSADRLIELSGNITGAGGLNVTKAGLVAVGDSVRLSGTNNYAGGTTIGTGATLHIGNGGTTGSITGNIVNSGALIFNRSDTYAFGGDISGTGALTKTGAGGLTLGGAISSSGITNVSVGSLIVDGSFSSSSNAVNIASDAALGGGGSIAGNVTFAPGALFVFSPTATLNVGGTVSLPSGFDIASLVNADGSALDWGSISSSVYTLISGTGNFSSIGNFGSANAFIIGDGRQAYFQEGSLQLVVAAIPEPSSFALIGGLGALAASVTRRRRRAA